MIMKCGDITWSIDKESNSQIVIDGVDTKPLSLSSSRKPRGFTSKCLR